MAKIQQSTDYGKFVLHFFNRDVKNTKKLEISMLKFGWFDSMPMMVVIENNQHVIKDGHHRFETARKIGIPVKYVIEKNLDIKIGDIEGPKNNWSFHDYLTSYNRAGFYDYIGIKKYQEETGLPISVCISVCSGQSASSNNQTEKFKNGSYKLGDQTHANILKTAVIFLKKIGVTFASSSNFAGALSKCIRVPGFDLEYFLKKAKKHKHIIEKQTNIDKYILMIEGIYNKANKNGRIPLAYLADEAAKKRKNLLFS